MAEKSTYIKLDRNMTQWRWWKNRNTLQVFVWLLISANISDHEFEHEIIKRGEVATSLETIGKSCSLTIREVRTALGHLKSTGEIASRQRPHYQVISILNYSKYQDGATGRSTGYRQANDIQMTSKRQQLKNDKNYKNGKKDIGRSAPDSPSGEKEPKRGTRAFQIKSHLLLGKDEGTVEDIPEEYRDFYKSWQDYYESRNQ